MTPIRFHAATVALAALLGLPASATAAITVRTSSEFQAAVQRLEAGGGTIVLAANRYGKLVVPRRGGSWLRIQARPGASARELVLDHTRSVEITGLRIAPGARNARLSIMGSQNVVFERLRLVGSRPKWANGAVVRSANVRFADSTFVDCGEGKTPRAGYCLLLRENNGVRIVSSRFRDCAGCDFVHGVLNANVAIRRNTFDRAVPGVCGTDYYLCPHQDLVHLAGGRDVMIDANRFGVQESGAAQVYLTGDIRRVAVTNNVFIGTDPRAPGRVTRTGLWVGNRVSTDVPRRVTIANNTILTGHPRTLRGDEFESQTSVMLSPRYSGLPVAERPLLVNNVIGLAKTAIYMCMQVRASIANVIVNGPRCSTTDAVGNPAVDAEGRPTAGSALLIDRGNARHATPRDLTGAARDARPDIGAYEHVR